MNSKHHYSRSVNILPRLKTDVLTTKNPQKGMGSSIQLPSIRTKQRNYSVVEAPPLKTQYIIQEQKQEVTLKIRQEMQQLATLIRENAKIFKQLKQNIMKFNDNTLVKKIIVEIKYLNSSKALLQIWKNVQLYEKCTLEDIRNLQTKYQVEIDFGFPRSMSYINNIVRFHLAEYKKKQWSDKERKLGNSLLKINKDIKEISRKIQRMDNPKTKYQIINSIVNLRQECNSRKQHYLDWKARALEKLRQNKIQCEILRAEVFAQRFS